MDNFLIKTITSDDYENALMNRLIDGYDVKSITWLIGTNKYKVVLDKKNDFK